MLRKSLLKRFIVSLNAKWGHRVYKIKNHKKKNHHAGLHGEISLFCRSFPQQVV